MFTFRLHTGKLKKTRRVNDNVEKSLRALVFNVQSIRNKMDLFRALLATEKPEIVGITENWIHTNTRDFFASVYTEEDTSEIPIVPIVYRGNNPLRKIEITVDKVKMKLKKLNSNKSAGPDGFYPRVIKEMEEETAPHFCNIFRTSLEQRKAVRDWKLQNISPLGYSRKGLKMTQETTGRLA